MTFQPNANWEASNNADVKRPIYAVSLDGGTVWYHNYPITSGTGANHYKYLVSITGVPMEFDPIRGESSIGGFNFELLTSAGIWNFDELFLTKVIVKAGYDGDDWSDFEVMQTGYIFNVANKNNVSWVFTCQDLQNQTEKEIFTGATVGSPVTISARNPITFWLQMMISDGGGGGYDVLGAGNGLGISPTLIDITNVELLRDDFLSNWQGTWTITEPVTAKDFFQDEIFLAFGITPVLKADGTISLMPFLPALYGYLSANGMAATLTDAEILELPKWQTNYRDVINRIIFGYDWDGSDYASTVTYNDTASQALYGINPLEINSKGITTALDGANLTSKIAARYFRKFAVLPQKIQVKTKVSQRIIEAGDQLLITSSHIPNIDSASFGWTSRVAEVRSVNPRYNDGIIEFELRDHNVGAKKYGVISPSGTPDYGSATNLQKVKYCWINQGYYII